MLATTPYRMVGNTSANYVIRPSAGHFGLASQRPVRRRAWFYKVLPIAPSTFWLFCSSFLPPARPHARLADEAFLPLIRFTELRHPRCRRREPASPLRFFEPWSAIYDASFALPRSLSALTITLEMRHFCP